MQTHRQTHKQTKHTDTLITILCSLLGGGKNKNCRNVFCVIGSINGGQRAENETMNAKNLGFIDNDCTNGQ